LRHRKEKKVLAPKRKDKKKMDGKRRKLDSKEDLREWMFETARNYRLNYTDILDNMILDTGDNVDFEFDDIRKDFFFKLDKKDRERILDRSDYPIDDSDYRGGGFFRGGRKLPKPIESFEDICKVVFPKLWAVAGFKFDRIVKKNWKKKDLTKLLVRYSRDRDDAKRLKDMTYRRQIEVFLQKLKSVEAIDYEKRDFERIQLKGARKIFIKLCGIEIPPELIFVILSYIKQNAYFLNTVAVISEDFYLMCLKNWRRIFVSYRKLYKVPLLVLRCVKEIFFDTRKLHKADFLYFWSKIRSVQVLRVRGSAVKLFQYLNHVKVNVKILGVQNLSKVSINKKYFPNIKWFSFNSFVLYEREVNNCRRALSKARNEWINARNNSVDMKFVKKPITELKEETREFLEGVYYITFRSDEHIPYKGCEIKFPEFLTKLKGFKEFRTGIQHKYVNYYAMRHCSNRFRNNNWWSYLSDCKSLKKVYLHDYNHLSLGYLLDSNQTAERVIINTELMFHNIGKDSFSGYTREMKQYFCSLFKLQNCKILTLTVITTSKNETDKVGSYLCNILKRGYTLERTTTSRIKMRFGDWKHTFTFISLDNKKT
jgi:hypothetical protein